eukprot:2993466-Prymnesium_polylepis.1
MLRSKFPPAVPVASTMTVHCSMRSELVAFAALQARDVPPMLPSESVLAPEVSRSEYQTREMGCTELAPLRAAVLAMCTAAVHANRAAREGTTTVSRADVLDTPLPSAACPAASC